MRTHPAVSCGALAVAIFTARYARAEETVQHTATAQITTNASPDAIEYAACKLDGRIEIGGLTKTLDVRVIASDHLGSCRPATDDDHWTVVVRTFDGIGVEARGVGDVDGIAHAIAVELERRLGESAPPPPPPTEPTPPSTSRKPAALG